MLLLTKPGQSLWSLVLDYIWHLQCEFMKPTRMSGLEEVKVEVTRGEDSEAGVKGGVDVAPIVQPVVCQD